MNELPEPLRSPEIVSTLLSSSADVIVFIDGAGVIRFINEASHRVLGRQPDQWITRSVFDLLHPDDRKKAATRLAEVWVDPKATRDPFTLRASHAEGHWVTLEASVLAQVEDPAMSGVLVAIRDMSERLDANAQLRTVQDMLDYRVRHDPTTRLPNRRELEDRLFRLAEQGPNGDHLAHLVMAKIIDHDALRDRHGETKTASILRSLAWAIHAEAGDAELVATDRPGEFIVVVDATTTAVELDALADQLLRIADTPLLSGNQRAEVRLAIGITSVRFDQSVGDSLDHLLKAALHGPEVGVSVPTVFEELLSTEAEEDQLIADDVERALAAGEFELYYQPIRDLATERVMTFEALLRWNHPNGKVLNAGSFLPAVEGSAIMVELGDQVLVDGCAQLAHWQHQFGAQSPSLALNVSPRQLRSGEFSCRVHDEIERSGVDPSGLCLELTETHALEWERSAIDEVSAIRELGVELALDDFGTGYSSLQHLNELGADVLKIDLSFVSRLGVDDGAAAIVKASIDLGRSFGATTIAEGVSTIEQFEILREMGCQQVQGFLFSPAVPAHEAEQMIIADRRGRGDPGPAVTLANGIKSNGNGNSTNGNSTNGHQACGTNVAVFSHSPSSAPPSLASPPPTMVSTVQGAIA